MAVHQLAAAGADDEAPRPATAALHVVAAGDPLQGTPFTIGDRTYVVGVLTARRVAVLIDVALGEVQAWASAGLLSRDAWEGVSLLDLMSLVPIVTRLWARVPDAFGKLLAAFLGGTAKDDPAYVLDHITLDQILGVLEAYMDQNPVEDLLDSFFRLSAKVQTVRARLASRTTSSTSPEA